MRTSSTCSKIGAILYIIWACLHFMAAHAVYALGHTLEPSMMQGRVYQAAWNLLFFSIFAIGIAATLNWKNSLWGYWINFAIIGVADVGFVLFVIVPGYMPVWPGILGPALWVLGVIFSTIALLTSNQSAMKKQLDPASALNRHGT
jgi:hypothetical protein